MNDDGKSLFFLILSLSCIWLILDMFYGKKYLSKLIDGIFGSDETTKEQKETEIKNSQDFTRKNNTTTGATNNASFPYKTIKEKQKESNKKNIKNNTTGDTKNNGSSISFNPSSSTTKKNNSYHNTTGGSGTSAFGY